MITTTFNNYTEEQAIQLTYQMFSRFGWVGCIFTKEDIRMKLEDQVADEAELEKLVEAVTWTRWWRKTMEDVMNTAGYDVLDEAIYEATEEAKEKLEGE